MKRQIRKQIKRKISPSKIFTFDDLAKCNEGDIIDFNGLGSLEIHSIRVDDIYREIIVDILDKNGTYMGYELLTGYESDDADEVANFMLALAMFFKTTAVA